MGRGSYGLPVACSPEEKPPVLWRSPSRMLHQICVRAGVNHALACIQEGLAEIVRTAPACLERRLVFRFFVPAVEPEHDMILSPQIPKTLPRHAPLLWKRAQVAVAGLGSNQISDEP